MLCLFVPALQAQTENNPTWLSLHVGHNEYDGDLGNEMFEYDVGSDWSAGLGYHQFLSPSFDFDAMLEYGVLDYKNGSDPNSLKAYNSFRTKYINLNAMLRYKLANGYIFDQDAGLQPFVAAGVGLNTFLDGDPDLSNSPSPTIDNRIGLGVPLAAGFDIPMSEKVKLTLKATYNRTFTDGFDGVGNGTYPNKGTSDRGDIDGTDHDDFLVTSIGVKFNIGGSKDSDDDGVIDEKDRCPQKAGPAELDGCPDTDGDGVANEYDRCPEAAGSKDLNGCPDKDDDGVADKDDQCPTVAGSKENNGCPDQDGDGVLDKNDNCPRVAGSAEFNGCPDTDGDGIMDKNDDCPETSGVKANNGCPQADYDFADLNYKYDKSNIEDQYKDKLDRVISTLQDDSDLVISLTGHADHIGPEQYNLRLSKRRAQTVKKYLTDNGISADRISTKGVGESGDNMDTDDKDELREMRRTVIEITRDKY